MRIQGSTRLVGIVGHPLDHTMSPVMHNAAFEATGLDFAYVPVQVHPDDFHGVIEDLGRLGFAGFNITMPYKEDIIDHLDEVASYAQIAGAVNTVQCAQGRLIGYNTDGRGFLTALESEAGFAPKDTTVIVIGAGGAACAAVLSLALAGAARIMIVNRTPARAERLARRVAERFRECHIEVASPRDDLSMSAAGADLVVNATSVGMYDMPGLPFDVELLGDSHLVMDLIYDPAQTEFLTKAGERGARIVNGVGMLVHQGANSFEIWTERDAPIDVMRKAVEDEVAARVAARTEAAQEVGA